MSKIIDIKDIITALEAIAVDPEAGVVFSITIGEDTILQPEDLTDELRAMYYNMSFISNYEDSVTDVNAFIKLWELYIRRYYDEWGVIWGALTADYDPLITYKETKTITPQVRTTNETTYASGISIGDTTTVQTNTYDGELRDSGKSTSSGNNSHTGKDTTVQSFTGYNTELKEGYTDKAPEALQANIDFVNRNNLRDLIINNFAREFLFYNYDYRGGSIYGIYY